MKVAFVVEWFNRDAGGVAYHVSELVNSFSKKGMDVIVITNKVEKPFYNVCAEVLEVNGITDPLFGTNISLAVTKKLKGFLNSDFDIMHVHHAFSRLPLAGLSLASKQNIPSVLTTHTVSFFPDYEFFWNFISYGYPRYRLTISKADKIIAVSEAAKKFMSYFTQKDIVVIPNGVSIKKFNLMDKDIARKKTGLNGDPIILYVGRLVPKKGVDVLILSMREVIKNYPHALLVISGTGKMLPLLKTLVRIAGLDKNVLFLGFVEDPLLPYFYNSADVFVLPSITAESFGIVLLEAMASGVPVISTKVGGIAEVLEDGKYGILVEPNSPGKLAKGIIELLDDKNLRRNMAKKGRKKVERDYSWNNIGKKIIEVYKGIEKK
ncbi:MAG: glycosyltransferase family 4 protein [Candidatus Thermoplasmatota archaeon]|nr:glycosyltransferase family 4 protein [Candidatus Thermoplasmatota archaeon]